MHLTKIRIFHTRIHDVHLLLTDHFHLSLTQETDTLERGVMMYDVRSPTGVGAGDDTRYSPTVKIWEGYPKARPNFVLVRVGQMAHVFVHVNLHRYGSGSHPMNSIVDVLIPSLCQKGTTVQ